jgi:phage gp36-like protein
MYCSYEDIQKAMIDTDLALLLEEGADEAAKQAIVTRVIEDADSVIDGYCSSVYPVPFTEVPAIIRKISVDIAIFNLYAQQAENVPDARELAYKEAVKLLDKIAKKIIQPIPESDQAIAPETTVNITSNTRVFSRDNLKGF